MQVIAVVTTRSAVEHDHDRVVGVAERLQVDETAILEREVGQVGIIRYGRRHEVGAVGVHTSDEHRRESECERRIGHGGTVGRALCDHKGLRAPTGGLCAPRARQPDRSPLLPGGVPNQRTQARLNERAAA